MELTRKLNIDPNRARSPWIIGEKHPADVKAGGGTPDIQFGDCKVFLGDRPLVVDFQGEALKLLEGRMHSAGSQDARNRGDSEGAGGSQEIDDASSNQDLLDGVRRLRPHWRYYLILFGLGVSEDCSSLSEIRLKIDYNDSDATPVQIIDVWPKTTIHEVATTSGEISTDIDIHGDFTDSILGGLSFTELLNLPFGGKLSFGGKGSIIARLSLSLGWPVVESYGFAATSGAWTVRRDQGKPLSQQMFCHVIHTQREVTEIQATLTVCGVYRRYFRTPTTSCASLVLPITLREET